MAKNDKKDADEEYQFEVPDFDEDAFIHKEMVGFKTTSILFVWGILSALVSWGLYEAMDGDKTAWYMGLGIMAVFGYLLRYVYPLLKVDISHFGRREWLGTAFLLFFAWLAFFILFVNPPISDHADPITMAFASPSIQQEGGDVVLDLFAADNNRIADFTFELKRGATTVATEEQLVDAGFGHWNYTLAGTPAGSYTYSFTATDPKGNEATSSGNFAISARALAVEIPTGANGNELDQTGDEIIVTVKDLKPCEGRERKDGGDCLRTVYLLLDNGNTMHLEFDQSLGWFARAAFLGWSEGENTFSVVAETSNQFQGANTITGGDLVLAGPYNVTVSAIISDYEPDVLQEVTSPPITRRTPAGGAGLVGLALVGGALLLRRQE